MAGKKKAKKQEKKVIDEYQLRKDLRQLSKMPKSEDVPQKDVTTTQEPRYAEDIRIGGIEG